MVLFYDHLVNKQQILIIIDNLPEPETQKYRLKHLIDDIIHQGLVEYILQRLHPHHHKTFLDNLHSTPYDPELIKYLQDKISPEFETELSKEADKLIEIIKKDLGL